MTTENHYDVTLTHGRHPLARGTFLDAPTRIAETMLAADVTGVYQQTNDNSLWLLESQSGGVGVWRALGVTTTAVNAAFGVTSMFACVIAMLFGVGADGSASVSSGTTTLSQDSDYVNFTPTGTAIVLANSWRFRGNGILDAANGPSKCVIESALSTKSGGNATGTNHETGGVAGSALANHSIAGTVASSAGATGTTTNGAQAAAGSAGRNGGNSGASGAGGAGSGGTAGASRSAVGALGGANIRNVQTELFIAVAGANTLVAGGSSGSGGGSGGGNTSTPGGGGGGGAIGGGVVFIAFPTINRGGSTGASFVCVEGGVGGNGGDGNASGCAGGGGASGGGGGWIYGYFFTLTGTTATNFFDASGGAGGNGGAGNGAGGGGNGGGGGNAGRIDINNLSTGARVSPAFSSSGAALGTAGSAASGTTGGTGGAGGTNRMNL